MGNKRKEMLRYALHDKKNNNPFIKLRENI